MQRRDNFTHLILASVIVLGLTPLIVEVDVQAQIAFMSDRDGNWQIYVINTDGKNPRNLTNNPHDDTNPAWYNPAFAVAPTGKILTMWGWLKQIDR